MLDPTEEKLHIYFTKENRLDEAKQKIQVSQS